ncbi:hypothetical protein scyTo_0022341, partial [Scyliorhinus torazame]|nr:hypothetical protein [Scyliorhinus torazame]
MKGFGSDKETIIDLLTSRSNAQRQQICAGYKTLYGRGLGTDENCVIELLASRNNKQIHELTKAYNEVYESDLETDIVGDTSGHFKKMLVVLLQGTREEDDVVSDDLVAADAK